MQFLKKLSLLLTASVLILSSCDKSEDDPKPAATITANAGQNQEVEAGETVTLDGSDSEDSAGESIEYLWEITKKPIGSTATLSDETAVKPTFVADLDGEYEISLTVTSETGTDTDNVLVTAEYLPFVLTDITEKTVLADRTTNPNLADYWVNEDIGVDAELVVMPGVIIAFAEDASMFVNEDGILIAKGIAENKITFTGKADQEGYWRGIMVYSGSNMNEILHAEILNAGSIDMVSAVKANITVAERARINIKNTLIDGSDGYGIYYMEGSNITGFAANTISNNNEAPLLLTANHVAKLDAASSLSVGNTRNVVEVMNSFLTGNNEIIWPAFTDSTPYRFLDVITVLAGWKLSPGITIEIAPDSYVEVGEGYINAVGTEEKKITITGVDKSASSWNGIVIYPQSNFNIMENVVIEYGGNDILISDVQAGLIVTHGASLDIRNSTISNSGGYGIFVNGSDVIINADVETVNTFTNNALNPVLYRP